MGFCYPGNGKRGDLLPHHFWQGQSKAVGGFVARNSKNEAF